VTVSASLKFTQGPFVGGDGEALLGRHGTNVGVVVCNNADNTDVVAWEYKLIEFPDESALLPGVIGTAATATFTEDVVGSYTVMVTVKDVQGVEAADVRVFVAGDERGLATPPFAATETQCNFGGQARGWKQMEDKFARCVQAGTPYVTLRVDQVNLPLGVRAALSGDLGVDPTGADFTYVAGGGAGQGTISWTIGLPELYTVEVIPNPTGGAQALTGSGQRIDATSCRIFVQTPAGAAADCDCVIVKLTPRL